MANKLTSEQMGMLMMALIVGTPLCLLLLLMIVKADADRRMDHIERIEREKTERKRVREHQPPVVVITGPQQKQLPPVINNTVQTAILPDGRSASRMLGSNAQSDREVRRLLNGSD